MKRLTAIFLAIVISGCSNPKDASNANFKQAIQTYLNTEYPKCYFYGNYPTKSVELDFGDGNAILHALARAGLLSEKEISRKEVSTFGFGTDKKTIITYEYKLTDEGTKYYKPGAVKLVGGRAGGFCAGKATVASIEQFSAPADMGGLRVTNVTYTYTVTDLPSWANDKDLWAVNADLKKGASSRTVPLKETDTLILTNKGWVHEKLYHG